MAAAIEGIVRGGRDGGTEGLVGGRLDGYSRALADSKGVCRFEEVCDSQVGLAHKFRVRVVREEIHLHVANDQGAAVVVRHAPVVDV